MDDSINAVLEAIWGRKLLNRYFVVRHGESEAMIKKIIVSDPSVGINGYGLTKLGCIQVTQSIVRAKNAKMFRCKRAILTSDFLRTRQGAWIMAEVLNVDEVRCDIRLRERWFGAWDLTSNEHYHRVWENDVQDFTHNLDGVQSVSEVFGESLSLIRDTETMYRGYDIFFSTHGDRAQITETPFKNIHPSLHRTLVPLQPGELRLLN